MLLSIPSDSAKAIFASLLLFGSYSMGTAQNLEDHPLLSNNAGSVRAGRGLAEKATKTPKAPAEITTKAPKAPKGATLAPTPSPSTFPSFVPSETPCYDESEVTELLEILGEISDICLMLTEGTPQNLAYVYVRDYPYDLTLASSTNAEWHQRFALSVMYYSITGTITGLSAWLPSPVTTDECDWDRMYCIDGTVFGVSFAYLSLEGTIPSEIGGLSALTSLDFFLNPSLTTNNNLEVLTNLQNLEVLFLPTNGLTSLPTEIGNVGTLKYLDVNDNALTSIPTELGNLENLETLILFSNPSLPLPLPSEVCDLLTGGSLTLLMCDAGTGTDCCI